MNAPRKRARPKSGKSAARLAAVQALYQMELTGVDANTVVEEFCAHRFSEPRGVPLGEPDEPLFRDLVHGVPHYQLEIDRAVANGLSERWKLQRIDSILRAILRASVYELIARKDTPAKAVMDEYIDIAHAFFPGDEPAFVNAILDQIARAKRAPEFGGVAPNDELQF